MWFQFNSSCLHAEQMFNNDTINIDEYVEIFDAIVIAFFGNEEHMLDELDKRWGNEEASN